MIQRIQSVHFLLASLLLGATAVFQCLNHTGDVSAWDVAAVAITSVAAVLSVVAIFLFKNRGRQLVLSGFAGLFTVAALGFASKDFVMGGVAWQSCWWLALPVLAFVFLKLAARGIKHDEELVRAADRIR